MRGSIRVGGWLVEPHLNSLKNTSHELKIEPRIMSALAYLAEHPDEVVSREQILKEEEH